MRQRENGYIDTCHTRILGSLHDSWSCIHGLGRRASEGLYRDGRHDAVYPGVPTTTSKLIISTSPVPRLTTSSFSRPSSKMSLFNPYMPKHTAPRLLQQSPQPPGEQPSHSRHFQQPNATPFSQQLSPSTQHEQDEPFDDFGQSLRPGVAYWSLTSRKTVSCWLKHHNSVNGVPRMCLRG